jgi:hypothetical protein
MPLAALPDRSTNGAREPGPPPLPAPQPPEGPPAVAFPVPPALRDFVAARLPMLGETARKHRLDDWATYLAGDQYRHRQFDEHGCIPGSMIEGGPDGIVGWENRRVRAVDNIAGDIVVQLTQWSVVGSSWCQLSVPGDEAATEWLEGLAKESELAEATAECVFVAGGNGTAVVSAAWCRDETDPERGGAVRFEVHPPALCWPLSWVDERSLVPHEVVKVFRQHDPYARKGVAPRDGEGRYVVRYWSGAARLPDGTVDPAGPPGVEGYYLAEKSPQGGWSVREAVPPVLHGSDRCPVFWVPRGRTAEQHGFDGKPFFAGAEGLIDAANELEQAADNTSKRNADDTLVIKDDPDKVHPLIKKGALGAIVAKGGAEYLSQKGDSAKVLYETAKERKNQAYRQSHVVKIDIDTLARQTSGEALRRLFLPMISEADEVRAWVTRHFVRPACEWLLKTSRQMVERNLAVEMPLVQRVSGTGEKSFVERKPGKASSVGVEWPQAFPPTLEDMKSAATAASTATGGNAVLSRRTGIAVMQRAGAPIDSPEAELERLRQDADEAAEKAAAGLGLAAEAEAKANPDNAKAGDITEEPKENDE